LALEGTANGGGIAPVSGPSGPQFTRRGYLIIALLVFAAAIVFAVIAWMNSGHKPELHDDTSGYGPNLAFTRPPEPRPAPVYHPLPMPMTVPTPAALRPQAPVDTGSALDSAMTSYRSANAWGSGSGGGAARLAAANGQGGGADDELSQRLHSSNLGPTARAHVMPHPDLTIPAGTVIPCILQTAINSQLVGFVDCVLPQEVRAATGAVTLLDKGTQIFGEIRSGLRQGQDRLFILWVRARTPQNVVVELDSPAADELGRAGAPGAVDNHFWARFGAALLFSVIDYVPQIAANQFQNNSGHNNIHNYTQFLTPQQQLANTILSDTINIPPTLEKNQGDSVTIFVGRDLDFSSVYDLQPQP
jgi:type IV secretion system protein VirB10